MVKSQPILRYILRGIPMAAVVVLPSACSANNTVRNMHPEIRAVGSEISSLQVSQNRFENLVRNVGVRSRITDQYASWRGVCYHLGDSIGKGIDCSGFVQRTFREQFGLELPRSTHEQQEVGRSVSRSNLRMDDLILFRAGSTGRHAGIYVSNNRFVRASTNSGVTISNMNEPYWKKHYSEARRALNRS